MPISRLRPHPRPSPPRHRVPRRPDHPREPRLPLRLPPPRPPQTGMARDLRRHHLHRHQPRRPTYRQHLKRPAPLNGASEPAGTFGSWTSSRRSSSRTSNFRQVEGPSTRIDITGAFFSTQAQAVPRAPLAASRRARARRQGRPTAAARSRPASSNEAGEEVGRNVQQFVVEPGKFGYRLVKGELEFDAPGTIEAHCTITETGSAVVVPLTVLGLRRRCRVSRYAAALSTHPVAFEAVGAVAGEILEQLDGDRPDLLVCFVSRHHVARSTTSRTGLRALIEPDVLLGATAVSIAGGSREVEDEPALERVGRRLGRRPRARASCSTSQLARRRRRRRRRAGRRLADRPRPATRRCCCSPIRSRSRSPTCSSLCNERVPGLQRHRRARVGRPDGRDEPARARRPRHATAVRSASCCRPRSRCARSCRRVAGRSGARSRSRRRNATSSTSSAAAPRSRGSKSSSRRPATDERELLARGLHVGIVVDEHQAEFDRGDFLVRNVLDADHRTGTVTVGEQVEVGQTLQFQVRDADAADEDLAALLAGVGRDVRGALLFTCNGRGVHLFGRPRPRHRARSRSGSVPCRSRARSAPARSARSAAATSSTASPPASPCSA